MNIYAPVLIPTLNRYEHLKRCVESLAANTDADKTELIIGLDYPPTPKYEDGFIRIKEYLPTITGFKKVTILTTDVNLNAVNNANRIIDYAKAQGYSSYIFTEDDNEFSPCFLQYMNKAFEKFYDDDRVILICGYNYKMTFPEMYKNNFYLSKWGCPWGTGEWVHKREQMREYYNNDKLKSLLRDDKTFNLLMKRSPRVVQALISQIKNDALWGDTIISVYKNLFDKYCLMPRESMVRNWGNDGTGEHSKKNNSSQNNYYILQPISQEKTFEFSDDIFTYEPVYLERHLYARPMNLYTWLRKFHSNLSFKIDLLLLRKFNYLPKSRWI